jgi:CTP:molybdopterin cytidylyltransferase MocA
MHGELPMLQGVIAAAGLSRRMKDFKPLLKIGNRTMIEQSIFSMLDAGVQRVIVVLGYRGTEIEDILRKNPNFDRIHIVYNLDYAETEMLDSIKLGLLELGSCGDFFFLPGDVPAVSPQTFRTVYLAHQRSGKAVSFPSIDGYRKHPPLISAACTDKILSFQEDGGLRQLWKTMEDDIELVPVEDLGCTMDADYPKDYWQIRKYLRCSS